MKDGEYQITEKNTTFFRALQYFCNINFNYCSHSKPFTIGNLFFCSITKCPIIAAALCLETSNKFWLFLQLTELLHLSFELSGQDVLKMDLIKWIKSDRPNFIITLEWQAHPLIIAATKWKLFIKSCAGQFSNILIFSQVVKKIHKMSSLNVYILYFTSPWILSSIKTIS